MPFTLVALCHIEGLDRDFTTLNPSLFGKSVKPPERTPGAYARRRLAGAYFSLHHFLRQRTVTGQGITGRPAIQCKTVSKRPSETASVG